MKVLPEEVLTVAERRSGFIALLLFLERVEVIGILERLARGSSIAVERRFF